MVYVVGPFDKRRLRTRCAACRVLHLKVGFSTCRLRNFSRTFTNWNCSAKEVILVVAAYPQVVLASSRLRFGNQYVFAVLLIKSRISYHTRQ